MRDLFDNLKLSINEFKYADIIAEGKFPYNLNNKINNILNKRSYMLIVSCYIMSYNIRQYLPKTANVTLQRVE